MQGQRRLLATLVADSAPPEMRGTAFGMYNLVTGAALLVASVLAGFLWDAFGAQWTFIAGAVLAMLTIMGLVSMRRMLAAAARKTASGTPAP